MFYQSTQQSLFDPNIMPTNNAAYAQWRLARDSRINAGLVAWRRELEANGIHPQNYTNPFGPLEGYTTSGKGPRPAPMPGASTEHPGIDVVPNNGQRENVSVYAMAPGRILLKGPFSRQLGQTVLVAGDDGNLLFYGHLQEGSMAHLNIGQRVAQGQVIGIMGNTGIVSPGGALHLVQRNTPQLTGLLAAYSSGRYQPLSANSPEDGVAMAQHAYARMLHTWTEYPRANPMIAGRTYRRDDPIPAAPAEVLEAGRAAAATPSPQQPVVDTGVPPAISGLSPNISGASPANPSDRVSPAALPVEQTAQIPQPHR